MKKNILFLGSNEDKISHFKPAKDLGLLTTVIKPNPKKEDYKNFDYVIKANLFNVKEVVEKIKKNQKIDACVTRFEPLVPLLGYLCDKFNLIGPSFKSCMNARDKLLMRKKLKKLKVPQPEFYEVNTFEDLKNAAKKLGFPFILKPISGAKSRFIQKINNKKELEKAFKLISKSCKNHKGNLFRNFSFDMDNNFKNTFLAEEYITGKQVTTTSFISKGKIKHISIADLITAQDLNLESFYLLSRTTPTTLPKKIQREVYDISSKAITALGVNNTFLHPELILTKNGPKIIEVAARVGGYRTEMVKYSFGLNLDEIVIRIALGLPISTKKKFNKASTAIEIWPRNSGIIKSIPKQIKSNFFKINNKIGDKFILPPKGEKPLGYFINSTKNIKTCEKESLNKLNGFLKKVSFE